MCGPYPRRRYYHIREFRVESSASEMDESEDTEEAEQESNTKSEDILKCTKKNIYIKLTPKCLFKIKKISNIFKI